jgi:hypothetical protein
MPFRPPRWLTRLKAPLLSAAILLTLHALPQRAAGQVSSAQLQPISLPHLYWHFLIHQNELDVMAAQLDAQGKDGSGLRNDMQTRLGFSDADYAPIRSSSQRLAVELEPIDAQFKVLQGPAWNGVQAQALTAQRETYIANEVYNLSLELTAQNKAALESFMTDFFAPKDITAAVTGTGQEVQQ